MLEDRESWGDLTGMTSRLYARLAVANPQTHKISLSKEFIEVSEHEVGTMALPDHVVRMDLFEAKEHPKPKRRILMGVQKLYSASDIEDEFGPMLADKITRTGAAHAAFIEGLGKLVPAMPGDEIWHSDGNTVRIT